MDLSKVGPPMNNTNNPGSKPYENKPGTDTSGKNKPVETGP